MAMAVAAPSASTSLSFSTALIEYVSNGDTTHVIVIC